MRPAPALSDMTIKPPPGVWGLVPGPLQVRGVGVTRALREALSPGAVAAFAALTHLGDTVVLVALAGLVYLAYGRRSGAFVVATLLIGFGVVLALKAWLALARPPTELQYVSAYGYGFPSGHAVGATVGWGALALVLDDLWSRPRRLVVAGVVAGIVALSRVAIGVHYLVDVIVGVVLGVLILVAASRWGREEPLRVLAVAVLVALSAVVATGAGRDAVLLFGSTVGATVSWQVVDPASRPWGRRGIYASAGVGAIGFAGLAVVEPGVSIAFVVGTLLSVGLFLTPIGVERWRGEPGVA